MNDTSQRPSLSKFRESLSAEASAGDRSGALSAELHRFIEDPKNPRTEFDEKSEGFRNLVEDIREHGVLMPVVVVSGDDDKLIIRFGARRLRAARVLNLPTLPYTIQKDDRQNSPFAQVSENEQRDNLSPMELARFIDARVGEGMSKQDIAKKLRRPLHDITYLQALTTAPDFVLELYKSGKCRSPQQLYLLRKLYEADRVLVERRCLAAPEITTTFIDGLKAAIEARKGKTPARGSSKKPGKKFDNTELPLVSEALAQRIMNHEGTPVSIVRGLMIVRAEDGSEREVGGDALAQLIHAAANNPPATTPFASDSAPACA